MLTGPSQVAIGQAPGGEAGISQSSDGTYWVCDKRLRQLLWATMAAPAAAKAALPSV
jgi:hypothetical protein